MGKLIFGVLAFAIATAVLVYWGNNRSRKKPMELQKRLLAQGKARAEKLLRSEESITVNRLADKLSKLEVASRPDLLELKVNDPRTFAAYILKEMEQEHKVRRVNVKGKEFYQLIKE